MIFLEQNRVVEAETVIHSAAHFHCVFFQYAQTGCGFSRVANTGLGRRELFHESPRERGDSTKMREKIEGGSLASQNRGGISPHLHQSYARLHKGSVGMQAHHFHVWVQRAKDI